MPARTTRQQARRRAVEAFMASLDRIVPPDESVPLKGSIFRDREDQVAEMRKAVLPTVPEERAALEDNARVTDGGHCPHCGSDSVYLEKQQTSPEVLSPRRAGGAGEAALPLPQLRRLFFPLRSATGRCRRRRT